MTSPNQTKPTPIPAIIVYGTPTSPELTQASWFRAEDMLAAKAAAEALKFSVIELKADADKALTAGVHEGVLKGNGRMIVGSVSAEVYKRIEEYAAKSSGAASSKASNDVVAGTKSFSEQNTNIGSKDTATPSTAMAASTMSDSKTEITAAPATKPTAAAASDSWDALRIGSHVVAKCWEANGEAVGWWVGTVTGLEKRDYVIVWLDDPKKTPPFKVERKHVAILHPSYDVKTEWDEKRR